MDNNGGGGVNRRGVGGKGRELYLNKNKIKLGRKSVWKSAHDGLKVLLFSFAFYDTRLTRFHTIILTFCQLYNFLFNNLYILI